MLISGVKMLMSAELRRCATWFIYYFDLPSVRYNCAKFHHCRIYVIGLRDGGGGGGGGEAKIPPSMSIPKKVHPK